MEEKGQVLTGCDVSSLVIDKPCYRGGGRNPTARYLHFSFAARKESPTSMLVALPRQQIYGLEETPQEISRASKAKNIRLVGGDLSLPMLRRSCRRPLPGSRDPSIDPRMNVWWNIESRFLIRF